MENVVYNSPPLSIAQTLLKSIQLLISIFCLLSLLRALPIITSLGLVFLKFFWNLVVVSRKLSLIFLAMKAIKFISETLKKVMTAKMRMMITAKMTPNSWAPDFWKVLNTPSPMTIPIAIKNICTIEIVIHKMLIPNPEKNPF